MTGRSIALALSLILLLTSSGFSQVGQQSANEPPELEATPTTSTSPPAADTANATKQSKEKMARVWSNEPPLVRLARDKFGAELTETDAKFFAAVAANDWADLRTAEDTKFDPDEPASWSASPVLRADRINWLCTDPAAAKLVPSHGVWLRGANITGRVDLYRSNIPFSLTFFDCLFNDGINISHAKLEELDIRNCCSAAIGARAVQVAENLYLLNTSVYGGLDFIDSSIGGDFDFSGGLAFHSSKAEDVKRPGVALNFHDAKVDGDIKLGDNFRALGQVRLIGATIGRSLVCGGGKFKCFEQTALDARRTTIGGNVVLTSGFLAQGGVELRRAKIGGDLDCNGGRFIAFATDALAADLASVGGQVLFGDGYHAEGETRLINGTVSGDVDCDNGHFLHPDGDALSLDGTTIGRSLRISADKSSPTDEDNALPSGFYTHGTFRLWSTQVGQDVLADGAVLNTPAGTALLGCNLKVAGRIVMTGVKANGSVNLFAAEVAHEFDLRCSQFDGTQAFGKIALWGNSMQVHGHLYCNQVDGAGDAYHFRSKGLTSFQFATISMHWDLYGAEFLNEGGDALDASDCRVGGYVNLDTVKIDGRANFSRAKIDGMWVLNHSVQPEKLRLDLRFAHIWVIKDERLSDWPPAGQLQLEGLVYDHFDDDTPLDVNDRLAWLRLQYAPRHKRLLATTADASKSAHQALSPPSQQTASTAQPTPPNTPAITGDRYAVRPAAFESTPATMPAPDRATMPNPITPAPETVDGNTPLQSTIAPHNDLPTPQTPPVSIGSDPPQAADETASTAEDNATSTAEAPPDPSGRRYITQPYTQLASVYRAIGLDEQANTVLVARAERIGELAPRFSPQGIWYGYLGRLIGYGYEPFRAIKIGVAIILVGALVFSLGARRNLMAETKLAEQVLSGENETGKVSPTYPRFNALVYSLDVFLPFVDLNQVCYWIPGAKSGQPRKSRNCLMHIGPYSLKWSTLLHSYLWFQTLAGWTLCTLLAAAVTGIVQS